MSASPSASGADAPHVMLKRECRRVVRVGDRILWSLEIGDWLRDEYEERVLADLGEQEARGWLSTEAAALAAVEHALAQLVGAYLLIPLDLVAALAEGDTPEGRSGVS